MYKVEWGGDTPDIVSLTVKSCVNPTYELTPGGVGVACLSFTARGDVSIPVGAALTLYRDEEKLGVFLAEKPQYQGGLWKIEAYDRLSLLEQELGQWLYGLPDWPYTLQQLCDKVLEQCGVAAANTLPRHGDYPVAAFAASGITGRKLVQWICEVSGCFCRANPEGEAEFSWFTPTDTVIAPTGERFYYMDGFTREDYTVDPIEKVQLRLENGDVGAVYPDEAEERNTLRITGNYLLTTVSAEKNEAVAQGLYEHLKDFSYTPGKVVTVPVIRAGDIFTVEEEAGVSYTLIAMTCTETDGVLTAECTGAHRRDDSHATNTARYEAITGRVMHLSADVEGLKMQNKAANGSLAELLLQVEGIAATVKNADALQEQVTSVQQTAEGLTLQVEKLTQTGVGSVTTGAGYTFDDNGLRIAKTGQEMENLLDNTGMYVRRGGEGILTANAAGVQATDVTVRNYLIIGTHARFEDYPENRTACFYLDL